MIFSLKSILTLSFHHLLSPPIVLPPVDLTLTLWLMVPGRTMLHSQGLSNNPYLEPNQPNSSYPHFFSKIRSNITLPTTTRPSYSLFPVDSSILAPHHNLLGLIILIILGEL